MAPHFEHHLVEGDTAAVADRAHLLHDERRRAGRQWLRALDGHVMPDHQLSQVTRRGRRGTRLTDNFYARWTGVLRVEKAGKTGFWTESDDGSRGLHRLREQ